MTLNLTRTELLAIYAALKYRAGSDDPLVKKIEAMLAERKPE